jgi:predicted cupin superfamily sugar epimerase
MKDAGYWIKNLELIEHPEGGYFREIYRSPEAISKDSLPTRYEGDRSFSTSIYFLLIQEQFSAFHRLKSDELWHFYLGSPLAIHIIDEDGNYSTAKLGKDFEKGEVFQTAIKAGSWFGAAADDVSSYSLVGCTVAPGFDFADFELGDREELSKRYPEHRAIIERLTREIP